MRDPGLDGVDRSNSADLQKDASGIASANAIASKDSYTITIENLPVKIAGKYNFVFQYYFVNPDQAQSTPVLGPPSATYSMQLSVPDLSTAPTNVVATGGFYSYQLKWDAPTFLSYGDTIVYESNTNSFNSSSKVVYVGTANQCTILTSDILPKYVYVVHRDMFLDANKKGTVAGPITIQDPIIVDSSPPTNNFTVGNATVQDDPDGLFSFNKKILFNWTANTDTSTYGYQIRFRPVGATDYTYMSVPGRTVTSTYLYGVKAGQTYEIQVSTYDQFGNTNTSDWKSYQNIAIPGSTSLAPDVAITAGDMKMGYGIGGMSTNKGLYLGPENYWYIQGNTTASSSARISVGGTNDKLLWDGSNLSVTGNLTARSGSFTGNILLSSTNASIYNGTINAAGNLTGNGFALNATGLKVASGSNSVTLDATNGQITANAGTIGGWSLTDSLLNQNNARLSSTGYIELGGANTDNIIRLDANDATYRMWIGRNSSATAPFRVTKEGKVYATDAVIAGTINVGTALSDGTSLTDIRDKANNAVSSDTVNSRISTAFSTSSNYSSSAIIGRINESLGIGETSTSKINGSLMINGTLSVDALVGTYIYGKEIYQGYEPTFGSGFSGGGVHIKQDVFPAVNGFQPGILFYGTDKVQAGILGSWSSHNMTFATSYLGNYIDLFPDDNYLNIKNTTMNVSSTTLTLGAETMTISKITRGRPVQTWTADAGRNYSITHNQGLGATIVATAEHSLNDLVCTIRNKTATTATVAVYHRAGAAVSGDVWVNWVAFGTTN
jgi:hypothetical protein